MSGHKLLVAEKVVIPAKAGIQCFQCLPGPPVKSDADVREESLRLEDDKKRLYEQTLLNILKIFISIRHGLGECLVNYVPSIGVHRTLY